jgi:hypothetical protein
MLFCRSAGRLDISRTVERRLNRRGFRLNNGLVGSATSTVLRVVPLGSKGRCTSRAAEVVACVLQPQRKIQMRRIGPRAAVLAIVVAAPFERSLLALPGGFTLTTVEGVLIIASAMIVAGLGVRRLFLDDPIPLLLPGAVFLSALTFAAVAAPFEQGNAMRFVLRMAMAAVLFVMTQRVLDTRTSARRVAAAFVAVAAVVATIAILEAAQVPAVLSALTTFRPGFHVVGGQLRATSTLLYPTIASMYLELAFVFGLWLLLEPEREPRTAGRQVGRWGRMRTGLIFLALVLIAAGITATFTRAGLVAMFVAIAIMVFMPLARVPRVPTAFGRLAALAAAIVVIVIVSHTPELLAARLTTEGSQAWYGASYRVPATLELTTGQHHRVPVELVNTGRLAWDPTHEPRFTLAYHWLRAGSDEVVQFDGARTVFPRIVPPRGEIALDADIFAPGEPGAYTLVWDVVHEHRAWLSTEGVPPARTQVTVTGQAVTTVATTMDRLPAAPVRPPRPALWSAALRMASDHPWLGVGPDNYRHAYGPYLGIARWDERVHANNMYLEVLAGAGVVGLVTLLWLVGTVGLALWGGARHAPATTHVAALAALAVWVVVAGHGLVDSFLAFTTTYVSFAVAMGLAFSPGVIAVTDSDANRL